MIISKYEAKERARMRIEREKIHKSKENVTNIIPIILVVSVVSLGVLLLLR